MRACPSAVITQVNVSDVNFDTDNYLLGYNTQTGIYTYLQNTTGLIELTDYVTPPTAPSWVKYYGDSKIEQGQTNNGTNTPILVRQVSYIASPGTPTVYVRASDAVFGNADGSDARTTNLSY